MKLSLGRSLTKSMVAYFQAIFQVIQDIFTSAPIPSGTDWIFEDSTVYKNNIKILNEKVGTFDGSIYITFTDLLGKTISNYTGTSIPSKISDTRIDVTSGYLGEITLSSGHKCCLNHGIDSYLYFVDNLGDIIIGTLNGTLTTFWSNNADIEPYSHTLGSTLYKVKDIDYLSGELTINGDFSDGLTGWTQNANATGTAIVIDGVLTYTSPHGDYAETKQLNKCVVGRIYECSFDIVTDIQYAGYTVQVGRTSLSISNRIDGKYYVVAAHSDGFSINVRTNGTMAIDNISVKEISAIPKGAIGKIMPICGNVSNIINGFDRLSYLPSGSGAIKGLSNTYYVQGVSNKIPTGEYSIEQLIIYESDFVLITQDNYSVQSIIVKDALKLMATEESYQITEEDSSNLIISED